MSFINVSFHHSKKEQKENNSAETLFFFRESQVFFLILFFYFLTLFHLIDFNVALLSCTIIIINTHFTE